MCVRSRVSAREGERFFPNMSPECLLYPIQYLFLAPHISVPIDSSDSRQDNNRAALLLSFSPPLLLPSPRSPGAGMEGWKWRNKGREEEGGGGGRKEGRTEEMATAERYFLLSQRPWLWGWRDGGRDMRRWKMERGSGSE